MKYRFLLYVLTFSLCASSAWAQDAAAPEPITALLGNADVAAGEKLSHTCATCHNFEKGGPNKIGPNLWGIVGNVHAHLDSFNYSDAMKAKHGEKWDYDALNQFIYSPKTAVPGTKMPYAGMKNTQDRANLIAWLRTLSDNPQPLPTK